MKVCIVSLNALPVISEQYKHQYAGGAEVQLAQLALALRNAGHEVSMIVFDLGQPDGAVFNGVRTIKAFDQSAGLPGIRFIHPRSTALWGAMSRANADVYLHSCAGMVLGLLAVFCRMNRRRLVYRLASDADCDLRTALVHSRRDRWLYAYGVRHSDEIVVQSMAQQRAIQANFGRSSTVVRGMVDEPLGDEGTTGRDIDVLWVANLRPLKRPDRFLDLAEAIPQFRFHMAGGAVPGDESYYGQIERRALSIPNLTFHGKIPYVDVGRLFGRTKLFANTSEVEGFPNTFLQAWARGIPVVTMFDPDGMVARNQLGVAITSVEELIASVRKLLEDSVEHAAVSVRAKAYMDLHFDDEKVMTPYLRVLSGADVPVDRCDTASAELEMRDIARGPN